MGARFLHLDWQGGGSYSCTLISYATVVDLWCIFLLYKNRITGFQGIESLYL